MDTVIVKDTAFSYDHATVLRKSMALIRAIHNLSKLYHWKTSGSDFYQDHLFFDRIADTFNEDLVDKIAENYFMRNHSELPQLEELDSEVSGYTMPYLHAEGESCFNALAVLCNDLLDLVNNAYSDSELRTCRSVNVLLDEIAITTSGIKGLLDGRTAVVEPAPIDTFYNSPEMIIVKKEGVAELFIHKKLGIPEHVTIREAYSTPNALYKELSRCCPREARTVLQMAGNMPEDCEKLDKEKEIPYTD